MKAKNHEKLAGFEREFIDSKISEKPVKSRVFGDLQGVKNAPQGLLLSGRSGARITSGTPKTPPENLSKIKGFRRFFIYRWRPRCSLQGALSQEKKGQDQI